MHYARVEEGEVFVMGQGEKGDLSYASGLYRATADLDLGVFHDEFMSDERNASSDHEELKLLFGDEDDYRRHGWERLFQEWLLRKGHVERMPCKIQGETSFPSDAMRRIVPEPLDDMGRGGNARHEGHCPPTSG